MAHQKTLSDYYSRRETTTWEVVLDLYDFSGKTVAPYCTHEVSALGSSVRDIKKLDPTAKVVSGLAIKDGIVGRADNALANWLNELDLRA